MTVNPLVGAALVSGAGSLLGSAVGASQGLSYRDNIDLMNRQYKQQIKMAALQQMHWKQQFDWANEYNSPENAVQRYLAAGISPSAGFGGSTVGQTSAQPQMGSGGYAVPYPNTMQSQSQVFATLAQALSSLGSAFKNTAEGKSIATMLGEQVRGMKMTNDQNEWRYALEQSNLPKKQKLELGKMQAEILELQQNVNVATQDELLKIEQRFKTVQERINEITKGDILLLQKNNWLTDFNSMIELRKSQIASNYGSAAFSNASADREGYFNQLRADPDVRQSFLTEMKQAGNKAVAEGKISQAKADEAYHYAKMAAFADDLKEFDWAIEKARGIAGTVFDGIKAIGSILPNN